MQIAELIQKLEAAAAVSKGHREAGNLATAVQALESGLAALAAHIKAANPQAGE